MKHASEIIQELRSKFEAGDPIIHQLLQKIDISVDEEGLIKLLIPQRYQFFEPLLEDFFKAAEYLIEIECDHSYSCNDCGKSA